ALEVDDPLGRLVQRQIRTIPNRRRRVKLQGVVRLGRSDIGLVELDWRLRKSVLGVAALALQAFARAEGGGNHVRLVFRFEVGPAFRFVLGWVAATRIGGALAGLERARHGERDVLAVIANDVAPKGRPPLLTNAFDSGSQYRTVDLADVRAVQNRAHAGHFLGG